MLSENGSHISTEGMELRAILELLGSLKTFDHWPCASNQQLLSTAVFVDLFQSNFSSKTHSLEIGNQPLSVQDCLVISLPELIWVRISTSNLPTQCYKSFFVKKSGIKRGWCITTLTPKQLFPIPEKPDWIQAVVLRKTLPSKPSRGHRTRETC